MEPFGLASSYTYPLLCRHAEFEVNKGFATHVTCVQCPRFRNITHHVRITGACDLELSCHERVLLASLPCILLNVQPTLFGVPFVLYHGRYYQGILFLFFMEKKLS